MCFVRIWEGSYFCKFVCLFMTLFISDSHNSVKKSGRAFKFEHPPPRAVRKKIVLSDFWISNFFKVNFRKFQGNFFQNSDKGMKFWHNAVLIEHIKTYFWFFSKFKFFQSQKVNFRKFQGHFFKIVIEGWNFDTILS